MPKLDLDAIPVLSATTYPAPFAAAVSARLRQRLGDAGGLTQFGVNRVQLPPGCWSSQRHWHSHEDEFVMVLEGEVTLITDAGEEILRAGDCAAFPAGAANGHHLINRSNAMAVCLDIGSRSDADRVVYPDVDLIAERANGGYTHVDGTPYPA